MIDVSVSVGERVHNFKFKHVWQVKVFVCVLNWFVILLHKWYGVPMNLVEDE